MIIAALAEDGVAIPADLFPVEVSPVAAPYRDAFRVLSAARGRCDSGPLPIVYSEIITFADHNGYSGSIDQLEEFVSFIQVQDGLFLKHAADVLKQPSGAPK